MINLRTPANLVLVGLLVAITVAGFALVPAGATLPVRWSFSGEVAATLPRNLALLQMPLAVALVWAAVYVVGRFGAPNRRPSNTAIISVAIPALTALFALLQLAIVLIGAGVPLPYLHAN